MLQILAHSSGSVGMCGGQAIDLASVGISLSRDQLEQMHQLKTGALLRASVLLGALCGKQLTEVERAALYRYSHAIGLAFQVVDDILDATADSAALGKTAGKDAANNKPTYVSILGLQESKQLAENLRLESHNALSALANFNTGSPTDLANQAPNSRTQRLLQLADFIVQRSA
jgi:farnesyl diphosphate synthase